MRVSHKLYRQIMRFSPQGIRKRIERLKSQTHKARVIQSHEYFASIKNKYAGKRGFVIGNGPSLKISDLDLLKDEICIASNKIYLAFDQTQWRPTFYTIVDILVWEKVRSLLGSKVTKVLVPSYFEKYEECTAEVEVFSHLGAAPNSDISDQIRFSSDFVSGAYGGYTVTYENIQLAAHLGLNPIYIIGCDHYYDGEVGIKESQNIEASEVSNHFIKGYRNPGEIVSVASIDKMNMSYVIANEYGENNDIQIINATRGGFLEAFPREDFDDIVHRAR